jgi:hypothetical protein
MAVNATIDITNGGLNMMGSSMSSWLVTIVIFFVVLLTLFILSKNFRRFLYGAVVSGFLLIDYFLSRWIGASASVGDSEPLKWTVVVVGFIIISVIIGKFLEKTAFVKRFEKNWGVNRNEKLSGKKRVR